MVKLADTVLRSATAADRLNLDQVQEDATVITQWLHETVKHMVDNMSEDLVSITVEVTDTLVTFRVRVAPADIGKIIGKQGRTARALRTILMAMGMKMHMRCALDIVEGELTAPEGVAGTPIEIEIPIEGTVR